MTTPSIACLGVIGRNNNPLHISIFPSYNPLPTDGKTLYSPLLTPLQYSLLLSSLLDIFTSRSNPTSTSSTTASITKPTPQSSQPHPSLGSTTTATTPAPASTPTTISKREGVKLNGEYGLLSITDERLSSYGFETNTGIKFVCIVDCAGRRCENLVDGGGGGGKGPGVNGGGGGIREGDVKVVFKAMQTAYIRLLQNPFYNPDAHTPVSGKGGRKIESRGFEREMRRIGEGWGVGGGGL